MLARQLLERGRTLVGRAVRRSFHREPWVLAALSRPFSAVADAKRSSVVPDYARDEVDDDNDTFITSQSEPNATFKLSPAFVRGFEERKAPFGFNGLGELVYIRSYARSKPDGTRERWFETVERVVNGTYNMQKRWIEQHQLGWNPWRAQKSAQEMYDRIFQMKFLPPGRGLWAMGSPITEEKMLYAALNNCAFVSTQGMRGDPSRPFCFLMDAAMLGVGVGFDTKGAEDDGCIVRGVSTRRPSAPFVVEDTREGWVSSVKALLDAHFLGRPFPDFDYSHIRPAGSLIRGFGGVSSGPEALRKLHSDMQAVLGPLAGQPLTSRAITDLMNLIGLCVVSGNVRRTAEIALGRHDDTAFLDLKDFSKNPERAAYGWTSNNSIFAELGMDYEGACSRVVKNGEPGFAWLDNMRRYGRMGDPANDKDSRAMGGNPCLEQTLESYELCCLVETFPNNHESLEDFQRTLKFAYLYAKTVTLGRTHWPLTNRVLLRNRRIGCSMSGIAQFVAAHGLEELRRWCEEGYLTIQEYDRMYSDWLAIPRSIKSTSVKPSGTVSLLAGATPGMHYPESRFYIRRVRLPASSDLIQPLQDAGYHVEPAVHEKDTVVVSFPVDVGEGVRTLDKLSMWEQLSLAAFLQRHWADNQVSCTVTFDPLLEGSQLPAALEYFQYQLKGVSFLPRSTNEYPQMPYEACSEEAYHRMVAKLRPLNLVDLRVAEQVASEGEEDIPDKFCDSDVCLIDGGSGTVPPEGVFVVPDDRT
jgi:ribonucleoside-triphosphate reductase (thioredoxin)